MRDHKSGKLPAAVRAIFESAGVPSVSIGTAGRMPILAWEIDELAFDLFDQLRSNGEMSLTERHNSLESAAHKVLQLAGVSPAVVQKSLRALPQEEREAIELHLKGQTYKQIARRKGWTRIATLKMMSRAYAQIHVGI